jgi:hypothetical protein
MTMKHTQLELLLEQLCVELGFCLPPDEQIRLVSSPPSSVRAFTDAVFLAEGLDPQLANARLWQQVADRVSTYLTDIEFDDDV